MTAIFFHPEADAEVAAAAAYYEGQQEDLGKRFLSSVEDGLARIRINPQLYPLVDGDVRRCLMRTFPFGVLCAMPDHQKTNLVKGICKRNTVWL